MLQPPSTVMVVAASDDLFFTASSIRAKALIMRVEGVWQVKVLAQLAGKTLVSLGKKRLLLFTGVCYGYTSDGRRR